MNQALVAAIASILVAVLTNWLTRGDRRRRRRSTLLQELEILGKLDFSAPERQRLQDRITFELDRYLNEAEQDANRKLVTLNRFFVGLTIPASSVWIYVWWDEPPWHLGPVLSLLGIIAGLTTVWQLTENWMLTGYPRILRNFMND